MLKNPPLESSALDIPDHVIDRIARCLLPRMLAYFESEEGQRELASANGAATEVTMAAYRKRMTYDHEQRN